MGATESIIRSRLASSGAKADRMPTPRSKPSSRTYMNTASARMPAQSGTRSRLIAYSGESLVDFCRRQRTRRCSNATLRIGTPFGRTRTQEAAHEISTGTEDHEVSDDIHPQRHQHVTAGERRRDRVLGAHQTVDHPRLAADFGGHPARDDGHEAEWRRELAQ